MRDPMARAAAAALALAGCSGGSADEPPYGLTERVPVSGLLFPLEPVSAASAELVPAFPGLTLVTPVQLTHAPDGRDRVFVVELAGVIHAFPNDDAATTTEVFLDLSDRIETSWEEGLLGLAFDPDFAANGTFYVQYSAASPRRTVLSRFRVCALDPDRGDPASEEVVLVVEQPDAIHNGGCLAFGPDGMLYASYGDGGGQGDPFDNGQDRTSLLGTIVRIDPSSAPYAIPTDNPFVGLGGGVREEIYAYGFRNPWRFSFDRSTGELWAGDVGQDTIEELDLVVPGGNYGWSLLEGDASFRAGSLPDDLVAPVHTYTRTWGSSVIGGVVYRGRAVPGLAGSYVYGDFASGVVWALRHDGTHVVSSTTLGVVSRVCAFGEDEAGEVYALSLDGEVYRAAATAPGTGLVPARLSETGLFEDTAALVAAPGLVEYDVNAPLWSDGARKRRWLALPGASTIRFDLLEPWTLPVGTVLVKHFELDLAPGKARRLETRVLVHESRGWAGYTYRWNEEETDADLLGGPDSQTYTVVDPAAPGGVREQRWDYPSRAQCLLCHTEVAGRVLGMRTNQIQRRFDYGGVTDDQLRAWNHIGLFDRNVGGGLAPHDALVDPYDPARPVPERARSWLDVNCSPCHQAGATATIGVDFRYGMRLEEMGIVDVPADHGDLGLPDAARVRSRAKESSVVWERARRLDGKRMPDVGSRLVDEVGLEVLGRWIDLGPVERFRADLGARAQAAGATQPALGPHPAVVVPSVNLPVPSFP